MKSKGILASVSLAAAMTLMACASSGRAPLALSDNAPAERMLAYSGRIELELDDPEAGRLRILESCREYGGFVTRDSLTDLLLRVPVRSYDGFIHSLKEMGRITQSEIHGEDITDAYEDMKLELDSKYALRDRYRILLERAANVSDALSVEKELERIDLEIQRLEGRRIEAEKKAEYVTLEVELRKKVVPGPFGWIFYLAYKAIAWLFVWD